MRPLSLPAAALLLLGCKATFPMPIVPPGLRPIPAADVRSWAASTAPPAWLFLRFSFRVRDEDGGSHGGRGSVFYAPPDSIHLDFRGSFGMGSGAAVVVGDSALWAEPKDQVARVVPSYHLLWAMVGVARPPGPDWTTASQVDAKANTVLYTRGSDTVLYTSMRTGQPRLVTYVVEGGKPIGRVWADFDQFRHLTTSKLVSLSSLVQVDISFEVTKQLRIDKDAWHAPSDH